MHIQPCIIGLHIENDVLSLHFLPIFLVEISVSVFLIECIFLEQAFKVIPFIFFFMECEL